ncbi:ATP-binding protein [Sphaerotilus mobilis]|uniref:histidine kinase n=1 Tax=Sphaerotilus mobilis TaxID=47994 RepID=A0A4Q7LUF7_9BURK|nr:ATP-binding protein [Sphaerotilus mobilis]RZS58161.1 PAS domain S-box-containing protein [Sphaerotilus mobilis]
MPNVTPPTDAIEALRLQIEDIGGPLDLPALLPDQPPVDAILTRFEQLTLQASVHRDQFEAVFALSPDGLVLFDEHGRVRRVNAAFCAFTGLPADALQGLEEVVFLYRLNARCAPPSMVHSLEDLREISTAGPADRAGRDVLQLLRPQERTLRLRLYRGFDAAWSQVLQLRDITAEAQVDRLKSEFLAMAAHELRTPMASIYGFVELMLTRELSPAKQRDMLERIHRQSGVMVRILNELLDLARIESGGGLDFAFEPLEIGRWLEHLKHQHAAPPGREAFRLERPQHEPMRVRADAAKLEQALGNLLSNAYKYSPPGSPVRVTVWNDRDTSGGPWVAIAVSDAGIGLSDEEKARVGERFFRADKSGQTPGTGLGISIVQQIVELHGGRLSIHSVLGQGSTFTLRLPLQD